MNDKEHEGHFRNALSNYGGVLDILAQFDGKEIIHNPGTELPGNWEQEHFLLYGEYLDILNITENEKQVYRESTAELIDRNGAQWFWQNRRRLAAEIIFIRHF